MNLGENFGCFFNTFAKYINILLIIIYIETSTISGKYTQFIHNWLGTQLAGAYGNSVLIEELR